MKLIQLVHSVAAIATVVGGDSGNNDSNGGLRLNSRSLLQNTTQNNSTLSNITCAVDETPCHVETGVVESCAKKGESCPCYYDERQCSDPHFGEYCDVVCCEWGVQERCRQPDPEHPGWFSVWCPYIDEGGCPCPEGQTKCGRKLSDDGETLITSGYCANVCCEDIVDEHGQQLQETCYDENYEPSFCAWISGGGCPCPWKQSKCGATEGWAGYCTEVCCDHDEETCYDDQGKKSCSKFGCSAGTSHTFWQSRVASTILSKGTGSQISYYSAISSRKKEMLLAADTLLSSGMDLTEHVAESSRIEHLIKHLEEEEAALYHAIRLREREKMLTNAGEEVMFSIS